MSKQRETGMKKVFDFYAEWLHPKDDLNHYHPPSGEEVYFVWGGIFLSLLLAVTGLVNGWSIGGLGGAILFTPIGFAFGGYIGYFGIFFLLSALEGVAAALVVGTGVAIVVGIVFGVGYAISLL
ncbi:MAG: hypothetical protein RIM96_00940 [Thalassobaculum sp.]|uniref:hypothetical protein n=1 Tax=Thalassobaculum sp. TaxID=2022740 RepID=UPI0032F04D40